MSASSDQQVEMQGYGRHPIDSELTLLEHCEAHDIPMESACGGFAACNSCRVRVIRGADALSPLREEEEAFLDRSDQRLGCQVHVLGPAVLRLDPGM